VAGFVDLHSHVIPSGDDGSRDVEEGIALCRQITALGTRVLYGTPHAHPPGGPYTLTPERAELARTSYAEMKGPCAEFGLDLRLGWELSPAGALVGELADYVLEGTRGILLELPGPWLWVTFDDPVEATRAQAAEIRAAGFEVVLAHPERCVGIQCDAALLEGLVAEGALVCFNADSFVGAHEAGSEESVWQLLDRGLGDFIASDSHTAARPSRLDEAVEAIAARYGRERAIALADGSALSRIS
jgi:protein-tyrosine phosphatase